MTRKRETETENGGKRRQDLTHTCEVQIFDGRVCSYRDAKVCSEAGNAMVSSVNLSSGGRYVVLVGDSGATVHILYLEVSEGA